MASPTTLARCNWVPLTRRPHSTPNYICIYRPTRLQNTCGLLYYSSQAAITSLNDTLQQRLHDRRRLCVIWAPRQHSVGPGSAAGLACRGSEKRPLNFHLFNFSVRTHKLEVELKSWEGITEMGNILLVRRVLISLEGLRHYGIYRLRQGRNLKTLQYRRTGAAKLI
jgi:hypothetical protein